MNTSNTIYASGARIVVRDAEWLIRRVDRTSTGGQALNVTGISELVKDKEAIFLDEIEKSIKTVPLMTRCQAGHEVNHWYIKPHLTDATGKEIMKPPGRNLKKDFKPRNIRIKIEEIFVPLMYSLVSIQTFPKQELNS